MKLSKEKKRMVRAWLRNYQRQFDCPFKEKAKRVDCSFQFTEPAFQSNYCGKVCIPLFPKIADDKGRRIGHPCGHYAAETVISRARKVLEDEV